MTADRTVPPRRARDAEASRKALLDAGAALFDARGYGGATVREIGERAGLDPALIARYFGSKEGLYLAVLADEEKAAARGPLEADLAAIAERLITRWDGAEAPLRRALASPAPTAAERAQLRRILRRLTEPAKEAIGGGEDGALRAELLVALLVGVSVSRANGTLAKLAGASRAEVLRQLRPLLDALERS
jgi:AcrR family transcriptional regulator